MMFFLIVVLILFSPFLTFFSGDWSEWWGGICPDISPLWLSPCVWTCGFGVLWASGCCRSGAEHLRRDVSLQLLGHQLPDHPQQAVELPRWGQRQPCAGIASGKTRKSCLHPLVLQEGGRTLIKKLKGEERGI